jgi:putative peptidoglycan lipid II flippase
MQFASWSALRDEATLGILVVVGAIVYAIVILALFGPRWLRSLVRA